MTGNTTERDVVDIGKEADSLPTLSDGELERLDQEEHVHFKWFKERVIVWISAFTIASVLIASLLVIALSGNDETIKWARQSLTVLLGFAAGAIWNSSNNPRK